MNRIIPVIQNLFLIATLNCFILPFAHAQSSDASIPEINTTYIWNGVIELWQQFQQGLPLLGLGLIIFLVSYFLARPLSTLMVKPLVMSVQVNLCS